MAKSDYILVDTGLNYAMIERYGGLPSAGILVDKPISGSFQDDIAALSGGEVPLGRSRLSLGDCYVLDKMKVAARFSDGRCAEVDIDHEEELAGYASLEP